MTTGTNPGSYLIMDTAGADKTCGEDLLPTDKAMFDAAKKCWTKYVDPATQPTGTDPNTSGPAKTQKYTDLTALTTAICNQDAGKFCKNSAHFNIKDVCMNYDQLPVEVRDGTSIEYACKADWGKVCADHAKSADICVSGELQTNLCVLNDEKCKTGDKYNACYENFEHCLIQPNFKICEAIPELCQYNDSHTHTDNGGSGVDTGSTNDGTGFSIKTDADGTKTTQYTKTDGSVIKFTESTNGIKTEVITDTKNHKTKTTVWDGDMVRVTEADTQSGEQKVTTHDQKNNKSTTTITKQDGTTTTNEGAYQPPVAMPPQDPKDGCSAAPVTQTAADGTTHSTTTCPDGSGSQTDSKTDPNTGNTDSTTTQPGTCGSTTTHQDPTAGTTATVDTKPDTCDQTTTDTKVDPNTGNTDTTTTNHGTCQTTHTQTTAAATDVTTANCNSG
jgi:hypothetical protein